MDTATKTGIDAAKSASKKIFQKTADKITSVGKPKRKEDNKVNKVQDIYMPPEKLQQFIDDLKLEY